MTRDEIRDLALKHGFTLRQQPDGRVDLNEYVYEFAKALETTSRDLQTAFVEGACWARASEPTMEWCAPDEAKVRYPPHR
jgi:hypothetical protein